ncbi:hypothetical protein Tco_1223164 [Tanacetum coccineum]
MYQYRINYYSREPATMRWKLEFSVFEASFPGSSSRCLVHHLRSLGDFIKLCKRFQINKLSGGRVLDDYIWMHQYKSYKITLVDEYNPWTNNEKNGLYEGSMASWIIQFFGWKEVGNHYLLAYERFSWDLQSYAKQHIFKFEIMSPPKDISSFLLQPFFWDPEYCDSVHLHNKLLARGKMRLPGGLTNVLDEGLVKEKVAQRPTMPYDYTNGCDLVRIFHSGFSHHGEMDKKVREKVGKTKADMVLYLNSTFPKLVMSLHTAGLEIYRRDVLLLDPDKAPSNLGVFYDGRIRFGR